MSGLRAGGGRRRGRLGWVLVLLFVGLPLFELYVLIQVGQVIGAWWTIALLVLASIIGAAIVRHEGSRAWRALVEALTQGRMPHRELADGALVLVGGTLLLTPGFTTDVLGALLVLPVTRPLFRALLARAVAARILAAPGGAAGGPFAGPFAGPFGTRPGAPGHGAPGPGDAGRPGPVVRGDVVDPDEGSER
ncbi:MAG: FxsA family protein [Nocardioides sp.]